ncbi:MAG TPA: 30S ribosomal protein S4 [Pirellulaceae bacterium]|nr:30S ribosomal protein S4 [Pirellulaceae bacterium]HMO92521.1 30S ribosomal protein S4 [Pirellulaceae bacterium]HMP68996.1 30S ribosomal protein S4 [Pirellulaceae bacterium]
MARYTGAKGRINRRLGTLIYENNGAAKAMERRGNQPPGMHTRGRRSSNYGIALMEKQKIKHYYGLGEKQLRRYFDKASRMKGNTGENLLLMCEQRLDNVVRRVGLAKSRPQARQGVAHGHFQVNGVKVDRPSYQLRPGDVITLRNRPNLRNLYQGIEAMGVEGRGIEWVSFDNETISATVHGKPSASDISLPVDVNIVVEFMSR